MSYLSLITPTNLATEKERFFSSKDYSPQLEYNWNHQTLTKFTQSSPKSRELANALLSQNGSIITQTAAKYFDVKFRPSDLAFAQDLISHIPKPANSTAQAYAELMRYKLSRLNLDYQVEIVDEHGFQGRPDHKNHRLKISKYLHLQFLTLDEITNHELVHIIRAVNGEYNHIPNSNNYLPTEEGLACLVQDRFLTHPTSSSFQHALEYLSAHLSQTAGFRPIYDFFISHGSDPENAWLRGIRQKFGMHDTSQPGSLLKSGMYFYYENFLRDLSQDQLLRLFVGKISISDLPRYPTYIGKVPLDTIIQVFFSHQSSSLH